MKKIWVLNRGYVSEAINDVIIAWKNRPTSIDQLPTDMMGEYELSEEKLQELIDKGYCEGLDWDYFQIDEIDLKE